LNVINRKSSYLALFLVFLCALNALFAVDTDSSWGINLAYYLDDNKGGSGGSNRFLPPCYVPKSYANSAAWQNGPIGGDPLNLEANATRKLGNGWGSLEFEVYYRFRAVFPLLQGDGLYKDNNLTLIVKPVISPVSFHVETEAQWTPIAFAKLLLGASGGTGWPLHILGAEGQALNNMDNIDNVPRSGWVETYFLGTTLQFDLAALVPGKWNHVVFSATAKAQYYNNSMAKDKDAWYWRANSGQTFNGWEYRGDYAIGYQPPWKVNFIGIVAEHRFYLSEKIRNMSTIASNGWGSDLQKWRFGPAMKVDLANGIGLTVLLQFANGLYYTEETSYARWFQRWETTQDEYIKIDRLVLQYSKKF